MVTKRNLKAGNILPYTLLLIIMLSNLSLLTSDYYQAKLIEKQDMMYGYQAIILTELAKKEIQNKSPSKNIVFKYNIGNVTCTKKDKWELTVHLHESNVTFTSNFIPSKSDLNE